MSSKTPRRLCGAMLPHENDDDGWMRCRWESGHSPDHEDRFGKRWRDSDEVTVTIIENIRAVPDHQHDFVGDDDQCHGHSLCPLTWMERRADKPFVPDETLPEDACVDGDGHEYPEHDWESTPTCRRCDAEPEEATDER